jgi:hypothetical protein
MEAATSLTVENLRAAMESLKDTPEREHYRHVLHERINAVADRLMAEYTSVYLEVDRRAIGRWRRRRGAKVMRRIDKRRWLMRYVIHNDLPGPSFEEMALEQWRYPYGRP